MFLFSPSMGTIRDLLQDAWSSTCFYQDFCRNVVEKRDPIWSSLCSFFALSFCYTDTSRTSWSWSVGGELSWIWICIWMSCFCQGAGARGRDLRLGSALCAAGGQRATGVGPSGRGVEVARAVVRWAVVQGRSSTWSEPFHSLIEVMQVSPTAGGLLSHVLWFTM